MPPEERFEFSEPYKGYKVYFQILSGDQLQVVPYQRKPSKPLINSLRGSIERLGFVVPLVVCKAPKGNKYYILDGQHRFLACRDMGVESVPCVIVPEDIGTKMMSLNIEKQPSIREKSYVALRVYKAIIEEESKVPENDEIVIEAIESPYFVTLGYVYDDREKFSGSAFEPILSKIDFFMECAIKEASSERQKRAKRLGVADEEVRKIVAKLKEMGKFHPFIYKEVVSFANPLKGKRGGRRKKVIADFHATVDKLHENLQALVKDPTPILRKIKIMEFE